MEDKVILPWQWCSDDDLHLVGIGQLFEEENISVPANGGKANVREKDQGVTRVLKAFGPCMILSEIIH